MKGGGIDHLGFKDSAANAKGEGTCDRAGDEEDSEFLDMERSSTLDSNVPFNGTVKKKIDKAAIDQL